MCILKQQNAFQVLSSLKYLSHSICIYEFIDLLDYILNVSSCKFGPLKVHVFMSSLSTHIFYPQLGIFHHYCYSFSYVSDTIFSYNFLVQFLVKFYSAHSLHFNKLKSNKDKLYLSLYGIAYNTMVYCFLVY